VAQGSCWGAHALQWVWTDGCQEGERASAERYVRFSPSCSLTLCTTLGFGNPTSIASIIRELQGIGEERFKVRDDVFHAGSASLTHHFRLQVAAGEYQLPPNTLERIQATQARTAEQESRQRSSRPRERKARGGGPEREAAESLVGLARRGERLARKSFIELADSEAFAASLSQQSPPSAPSSSFGGRRGERVLPPAAHR
jgi:hypothetical protein